MGNKYLRKWKQCIFELLRQVVVQATKKGCGTIYPLEHRKHCLVIIMVKKPYAWIFIILFKGHYKIKIRAFKKGANKQLGHNFSH